MAVTENEKVLKNRQAVKMYGKQRQNKHNITARHSRQNKCIWTKNKCIYETVNIRRTGKEWTKMKK